jgi:hypothetical protein
MRWLEKTIGEVELYTGVTAFQIKIQGLMVKSVRLTPAGRVRGR